MLRAALAKLPTFFFLFELVLFIEAGFPGGSVVKTLPALQELQVQSLGQEDSLEEDM